MFDVSMSYYRPIHVYIAYLAKGRLEIKHTMACYLPTYVNIYM